MSKAITAANNVLLLEMKMSKFKQTCSCMLVVSTQYACIRQSMLQLNPQGNTALSDLNKKDNRKHGQRVRTPRTRQRELDIRDEMCCDDDEANSPCSATSLLRTRSVLLATRIMALSRASSFRILDNKHVSRTTNTSHAKTDRT